MLDWLDDPLAERREAWANGWTVLIVCFTAYIFIIVCIGACAGWAEAAYPTYRETLFGERDRVVVRYKKRQAQPRNSNV